LLTQTRQFFNGRSSDSNHSVNYSNTTLACEIQLSFYK